MSLEEQIKQLNIQTVFTSALIVATSINIFIINMYKDILINKTNSKYNANQIYNLAILSSNIFLIVTIYFYIISFNALENNKTKANENYYFASVLSLTAQSIRVNTVYKYPETITGIQDIF